LNRPNRQPNRTAETIAAKNTPAKSPARLLPNSIIHPNPVCAIGWSKVISWGDDKASLETGQHFICNRLLQFRPGVFPIFGLPYRFWKDKVGRKSKS
jgi:hypothetical protein